MAQSRGPLDLADVEALVAKADLRPVVSRVVRDRCVTFSVDTQAEQRLRRAGADDDIVATIRGACFTGTEIVVESWPPGADIHVNGERAGTAPWTGRFAATGASVELSAVMGGRRETVSATLAPATRHRASFGFREDTIPVPLVPEPAAVARRLNVASAWRAPEPEPIAPRYRGDYNSGAVKALVVLGGAAIGAAICHAACGSSASGSFVSDSSGYGGYDTDGGKSLAPTLIGAGGGLVVGWATVKLIAGAATKARRRDHARQLAEHERSHATWTARMAAARERWILEHPDVAAAVSAAMQSRDAALAHNRAVRERSQGYRPTAIRTEPLVLAQPPR
jgi:hypothetical protein